jgi:hypothetical protein
VTNEQAVAEATNRIEDLKSLYMAKLHSLASGSAPLTRELLQQCQESGGQYFAFVENFVGNSGLLGAHVNGMWATGFAETCESVLESYVLHIKLLRVQSKNLGITLAEPSPSSNANMQRMVREYLPSSAWKKLKQNFTENNLPTVGFDMAAVPDKNPVPRWQLITSIVIGGVCLVAVVVLAVLNPYPSNFQEFVFRGLLAIALAAIAAIIPGFVNLKFRARGAGSYIGIIAGGALAIFILIWLVNPPSLENDTTIDVQNDVHS